jgi:hypothetical protein
VRSVSFNLGGCADPDGRDAAGQLGQSLLQLLPIVGCRDLGSAPGGRATAAFTPTANSSPQAAPFE